MKKLLLAAAVAALSAATSVHATSWEVTPYPNVTGASLTRVWSVNDLGVLVGDTESGSFIDDHGHRTWYAFATPNIHNYLAAISNDGTVIGGDGIDSFVDDHGTITHITAPGATQTSVRGISANGRYVAGVAFGTAGAQGFILDRATLTLTSVSGRAGASIAFTDVNDEGVAVGTSLDNSSSVVYDLRTATSTWFDALDGFSFLKFRTVNNAGEIGGMAYGADGHATGIIGSTGDGFTAFDPQDDRTFDVGDLNNVGQAVGGIEYFDGSWQPFVATEVSAVPEPASMLLIGSGLLATGLIGRRRRDSAR